MSAQDIWEVVILGIVQGIAEFLPISSSGHLVVADELLGSNTNDSSQKLALNIALHLGTLFSIVVIFWKDLIAVLKSPKMIVAVILATIPAVIIGFTLKDQIEGLFETPLLVGCCWICTAGLLLVTTRFRSKEDPPDSIPSWKIALLIGCFQAVAILPGISRSGSTIVAGLILGLSREVSARFSFFMAIPVIGGASLLLFKDLLEEGADRSEIPLLVIGGIVSFVVGIFALKWLLNWLKKGRLHWFAYYCALVGVATITWQLLK